MRAVALLALLLLLPGCVGLGGRKSSFKFSDGTTVEVLCQSDGRCTHKQGDRTVEVDNRGPLGQVWAAATASLGKIYDRLKDAPESPK